MSFAIGPKRMRCTNCGQEGWSRIKGTGSASGIAALAVFLAAVTTHPGLYLPAALLALWAAFKPAAHVCPKCGKEHLQTR